MTDTMTNLYLIGMGHIGLPTALQFANNGVNDIVRLDDKYGRVNN